jgi:hypothetical protein
MGSEAHLSMKEGCLFVLFYGFRSTSIYEGRLFVCFVLFVLMKSTQPGCFRLRSWSLWKALDIYLWRKVVCLFCFVCTDEIHPTRMLQIAFLVSLESSWWGGVHWLWFHSFWTCSAKVLEYWMISSLKIKLNPRWKFPRNRNVPFGVVGKILMSRI